MNVYLEFTEIAKMNERIKSLATMLEEELDLDGLDLTSAYFVENCEEKNGHLYSDEGRLDNSGLVDDQYYCDQYTGYLGDDFYGTLYFKTNVPGKFVAVPFAM